MIHHSLAAPVSFVFIQRAFCREHSELWCQVFRIFNFNFKTSLLPEQQCHRDLLLLLFALGFALPTLVLWTSELKSRLHYVAEMGISVDGSIHKQYMAILLFSAFLSVWFLVTFGF